MIRQDALFKGLTRKATFWDIPILPLFAVVATMIMVATITAAMTRTGTPWIIFIIFAVPVVGIMRLIVKHDECKFHLIWLNLLSRIRERNFGFWKAMSYGPIEYKKRSWS